MVVQDFQEFKNDLNVLREEIKAKATELDAALVAAWVDRLVIMLDRIADTLALLDERVNVLTQ